LEIFAIIKSPTAKLAGFPIVIVLLVAVFVAVAVPRRAICEYTTLPLNANTSSNTAFEITLEIKDEGRNVPMSLKNWFSVQVFVANIPQLIDNKRELMKN
jgi:hypothetical protein